MNFTFLKIHEARADGESFERGCSTINFGFQWGFHLQNALFLPYLAKFSDERGHGHEDMSCDALCTGILREVLHEKNADVKLAVHTLMYFLKGNLFFMFTFHFHSCRNIPSH